MRAQKIREYSNLHLLKLQLIKSKQVALPENRYFFYYRQLILGSQAKESDFSWACFDDMQREFRGLVKPTELGFVGICVKVMEILWVHLMCVVFSGVGLS